MRLEKSYLRLTSVRNISPPLHSITNLIYQFWSGAVRRPDSQEPDPADVRPLPVLRQTLDLLKKKWKEEENYAYICDQFKSLRQDLTVSVRQGWRGGWKFILMIGGSGLGSKD
jgi:hypothetical protein